MNSLYKSKNNTFVVFYRRILRPQQSIFAPPAPLTILHRLSRFPPLHRLHQPLRALQIPARARDVQRRVALVVAHLHARAARNERAHDFRLVRDDGEMEGGVPAGGVLYVEVGGVVGGAYEVEGEGQVRLNDG